jgi:hypothetical protein
MAAMNSHVIRIPLRAVAPFALAGALFIVPSASAATVAPVFHDGNPTCADVGYNHGLKFDPPAAGALGSGGVTVDMSIGSDAFGQLVDWTSTAPIDAVIVKGGSNANVYTYPGESSGDTGLHTPFNGPDKYYGLSHVDFCWDDQSPPPPDTETPPVTPPADTPPADDTPDGGVLPAKVISGRSRLLGPSGCAGKTVKATVRGRQIQKVTFTLDGRKVKTVNGAGSYSIASKKLAAGIHRIKARVVYKAAAQTRPRTHTVTFQRCVVRKIKPRFAG